MTTIKTGDKIRLPDEFPYLGRFARVEEVRNGIAKFRCVRKGRHETTPLSGRLHIDHIRKTTE